MQRGQIFRKVLEYRIGSDGKRKPTLYGNTWYGRWRQDEIVKDADGNNAHVERRQKCEKLCEYGDRYRNERDVQPLLDAKLVPLNEGRCSPESTLSVADYVVQHFLPYAEREMKPSTVYGYRGLWRMYLAPRLSKIALRDFRCVDATNLLAAIHRDHSLSRKSLRHVKGLMSIIFAHAKRAGALDGENPVRDAGIPRAAAAGKPTHAYSADEVFAMLNALDGVARTAVALMYFCGLRPGEARAARWENYDGKTLRVCESMWRTKTTTPKTLDSVAPVPVAETLADVLEGTRRDSGFILSSPTGKPADLHNLAYRVVVPALTACAKCGIAKKDHDPDATALLGKRKQKDHGFIPKELPEWRGWYAFRRGLATLATSLDSQMAAKSLLRHSNVATTQQYYIKSVPDDALRVAQKMDALFQQQNAAHA